MACDLTDRLRAMTGETNDDILETYLEMAKEEIIRRRYPFGGAPDEFPSEYKFKALNIATYLINKIGAEGETRHVVDGVTREYESAHVPPSMLSDIVPIAKPVGYSTESGD